MFKQKKPLLILLTVFVIALLGTSLGLLPTTPPKRRAKPTSLGAQPSSPQSSARSGFNFGQAIVTPPELVEVKSKPRVPREVKLYTLLPAPYKYFSVQAVQSLAQKLGFSNQAQAEQKNNLYIYHEDKRTLLVNPQAGTIYLANSAVLPKEESPLEINLARSKVKKLMQELNLDLPIINWDGAKWQGNSLVPSLEIAGLRLIPPLDYYARFDKAGNLVGLSFWLPNLNYTNPRTVKIITPEVAIRRIETGRATLVRGELSKVARLPQGQLTLSYLVRPEAIYRPDTQQQLELIYVFENDDVTLYIDARE